jgi:hypothetical protein
LRDISYQDDDWKYVENFSHVAAFWENWLHHDSREVQGNFLEREVSENIMVRYAKTTLLIHTEGLIWQQKPSARHMM